MFHTSVESHMYLVVTCPILARMDLFEQLSLFSLLFIITSRFLHYCCLPAFVIVFLPCEKRINSLLSPTVRVLLWKVALTDDV